VIRRMLEVCLLGGLAACVTAPPTRFDVPKERASECAHICTNLDMQLGAVVVIANAAGCVCEPVHREGGATTRRGGATAGAAMAIEMQNQSQPSQPPPPP
jgi:hypothetical protein